jgi:hypothetical protein
MCSEVHHVVNTTMLFTDAVLEWISKYVTRTSMIRDDINGQALSISCVDARRIRIGRSGHCEWWWAKVNKPARVEPCRSEICVETSPVAAGCGWQDLILQGILFRDPWKWEASQRLNAIRRAPKQGRRTELKFRGKLWITRCMRKLRCALKPRAIIKKTSADLNSIFLAATSEQPEIVGEEHTYYWNFRHMLSVLVRTYVIFCCSRAELGTTVYRPSRRSELGR